MNIITTKNELLEAFTYPVGHCLVLYRHQDVVLRIEIGPSSYQHRAIAALPSLDGGLSVTYLEAKGALHVASFGLVSPRDTEYYLGQGAVALGQPTLGEIPPRIQGVIKQALEAFSTINDAASWWGQEELLTKIRELNSNQYT